MRLQEWFEDPHYRRALASYSEFCAAVNWPVELKAELYALAGTAFGTAGTEDEKSIAFSKLYLTLRRWGMQRGGPIQPPDWVYRTLTIDCAPCSAVAGLTLLALPDPSAERIIMRSLRALGEIKSNREYPFMAASKFLHFFNPSLFPIWDWQWVWNGALNGAFRLDYREFCRRNGMKASEGTERFNLNYTLLAAECIRGGGDHLMDEYAGWFRSAVANGASRAPERVETYYAAAFESVLIGATRLERPSLFA